MVKTLVTFLSLLFFLASCASTTEDTLEGLPILEEIEFQGNESVESSLIKKQLALQQTSWNPLAKKRAFDASILQADKTRIVRIYEAQGIYGTRVVRHEIRENNNEVTLIYVLEEGNEVVVTEIEYRGLPNEIEFDSPLKESELFKEGPYLALTQELTATLKENGYPFASVNTEATVSQQEGTARVIVSVNSGGKKFFGEITVVGLESVPLEQFLEHVYLKKGNLYRASVVDETRARIFRLNIFRTVEVKPVETYDNAVPIRIELEEREFHSIGIGGGVGISEGRNELRGRLQFRNDNFLGELRRLEFVTRPAVVYVPSFTQPETKGIGGNASIDFFQPDAFYTYGAHKLGFNARTEFERDINDGFVVNSGKIRTGFIWPTEERNQFGIGYNWHAFSLLDFPNEVSQCGNIVCVVSYLDETLSFDHRDNPFESTRGWYLQISAQEAGLGGHFKYFSLNPDARGYVPLIYNSVGAFRINLGQIFTSEAPPIPYRFFAGGNSSHRGFGHKRLSPQVRVPTRSRGIPVGGKFLGIVNTEVRVPVAAVENLFGIAFYDIGSVESERSAYRLGDLNSAAGFGLKYSSAFAPIRFDLGYLLKRQQRFQDEPNWVFHFTLGDAY